MTRDEVIKGLECHKRAMYGEIDEHGIACNSCPYKDMESTCHSRTEGRLINDALALLNDGDMVRVVRCAECEHWEPNNAEEGDYSGRCRNNWGPCQNQQTDGTWFCEDGVRMEAGQ